MKPNFAYINIAFLISIAVLTILSFLFYQRSTSHLRYSKQLDDSYAVILELKRLDQRMLELENYSSGFMLSRDSAFLILFAASRDSLVPSLTDPATTIRLQARAKSTSAADKKHHQFPTECLPAKQS